MGSEQKLKAVADVQRNYEYSVKIMRLLLRAVGMWPITDCAYPGWLRLALLNAVCFLLALFVLPIGLHTFLIVKDFKTRVRNVGPFIFGLMNLLKFCSLVRKSGALRDCLHWLASDWRGSEPGLESDLMLASASTGLTFSSLCASFMLAGGMSYTAAFSFIQRPVLLGNLSLKAFAYPAYFGVFDPYEHFYKVWALHCMCALVAFGTTAAVASIAIALVMHVCGQISVVSYRLRKLAPAATIDKRAFRCLLHKHLRALELANKAERLLSGVCLVEVMGCCFEICILGYYIVTEFDVHNPGPYTYLLLFVSFTFDIFTFCYIGEQLLQRCSGLANLVYELNWYHLSARDARSLLMVIMCAHRPVALTAGKMAILSMPTFSSIMKAALSYLNMLRALTN